MQRLNSSYLMVIDILVPEASSKKHFTSLNKKSRYHFPITTFLLLISAKKITNQ
jgi:hypothetical protein